MSCASSITHGTAVRFVGVGDSSFDQIPSSAPTAHAPISTDEGIIVACATTTCVVLLQGRTIPKGTGERDDARPPFAPRVLEWGTAMYGERIAGVLTPKLEEMEEREHSIKLGYTATPGVADKSTHTEPLLDNTHDYGSHPTEVSPLAQLPPPTTINVGVDRIVSIACGAHFVVAAVASGGCITWGGGGGHATRQRVLGRGDCGNCYSCLRESASGVSASGCMSSAKPGWVQSPLGRRGSEVVNLAAGDDHAVVVCRDRSVWAWGRGDCGQLGCGAPGDSINNGDFGVQRGSCRPVRVQLPPSCSGTRKSTAAGSGSFCSNTSGVSDARSCDDVDFFREAACGRDHSALLTDRGRVFTFGSGLYGQVSNCRLQMILNCMFFIAVADIGSWRHLVRRD